MRPVRIKHHEMKRNYFYVTFSWHSTFSRINIHPTPSNDDDDDDDDDDDKCKVKIKLNLSLCF
jgi:hypothetical protein